MHYVQAFCQWLNGTPWSTYLRESDYPFPIIETFHVIGLAVSVGVIMWLDLRFLGVVMPDEPISSVVGQLEPWATGGFAIMFVSGSLLFLSEPMKCYNTLAFRLKVIMLILAGLNVMYFHAKLCARLSEFDKLAKPPWQLKMVAILSFVFWFGIIIAGRWTAYL
jgi:hypothetical protein